MPGIDFPCFRFYIGFSLIFVFLQRPSLLFPDNLLLSLGLESPVVTLMINDFKQSFKATSYQVLRAADSAVDCFNPRPRINRPSMPNFLVGLLNG